MGIVDLHDVELLDDFRVNVQSLLLEGRDDLTSQVNCDDFMQ
jgi:hypothetical protein